MLKHHHQQTKPVRWSRDVNDFVTLSNNGRGSGESPKTAAPYTVLIKIPDHQAVAIWMVFQPLSLTVTLGVIHIMYRYVSSSLFYFL